MNDISVLKKALIRFLTLPELYIFIFGFLINFWYEVTEIPFFAGWNRDVYWFGNNTIEGRLIFIKTFNRAALLDATLVLGCHVVNSLLFGTRFWFIRGGYLFGKKSKPIKPWIGYLISAILASLFLIITEINAAAKNLWGYSSIMPMIGELGLIPIIAMVFTPGLSFLLARLVYEGNIFREIRIHDDQKLEEIETGEEALEYIKNIRGYKNRSEIEGKKRTLIILSFSLIILLLVAYWYLMLFS